MNIALRAARTLNASNRRYLSSGKLPPETTMAMSKDMIVCWHPESEFPYEFSLPIPEEEEFPSNSFLCIGEKEIAEVFKHKKKDMVIEELSKMTYTTKHRWYPRNSDRRSRGVVPDRPYL